VESDVLFTLGAFGQLRLRRKTKGEEEQKGTALMGVDNSWNLPGEMGSRQGGTKKGGPI